MTIRYLYAKFISLILTIVGFSYCLTSFYNFYDYIFGDLIIANSNIIIMSIGLIIPLYMFIFGLYLYFYVDLDITKINKFILISSVSFIGVGLLFLILNNGLLHHSLFAISQVTEFLHYSISYSLIVLGILIITGCLRFKY